MIEEQGEVEVSCEFCNQQYRFDRVDLSKLFRPPASRIDGDRTRH